MYPKVKHFGCRARLLLKQDKGKHHREGAFIVMISPFENETEVKNDLLSGGAAFFFFMRWQICLWRSQRGLLHLTSLPIRDIPDNWGGTSPFWTSNFPSPHTTFCYTIILSCTLLTLDSLHKMCVQANDSRATAYKLQLLCILNQGQKARRYLKIQKKGWTGKRQQTHPWPPHTHTHTHTHTQSSNHYCTIQKHTALPA